MVKEIHDIWLGDSRELVKKFKPGRIDCLITDPPFGVDNLSNYAETQHGKEYARKIAGDNSVAEAIELFQTVFTNLHPALSQTADVYIFTSYQVLAEWIIFLDSLLGDFKYKRKAILIWEKEGPGLGDLNSPWGMGCEFIMYYQRGREKTARRGNSVIKYPQVPVNKLIHPHEKPPPLLDRLIKTSTDPGDFLVDPFAGSGSLVRACKAASRNCIGIETDPKNHHIALNALHDQGSALF